MLIFSVAMILIVMVVVMMIIEMVEVISGDGDVDSGSSCSDHDDCGGSVVIKIMAVLVMMMAVMIMMMMVIIQ